MDFFKTNSSIYGLLSKVVQQTQILSVEEVSKDKSTPYPRMIESDFIITEDIIRTNTSVVTAHLISEYRPSKLKLERLMRESHHLLIDILIEDIGGVRGVQIQSN